MQPAYRQHMGSPVIAEFLVNILIQITIISEQDSGHYTSGPFGQFMGICCLFFRKEPLKFFKEILGLPDHLIICQCADCAYSEAFQMLSVIKAAGVPPALRFKQFTTEYAPAPDQ